MNILLVDDEGMHLRLLRRQIEPFGWKIQAASSFEAAVRKIEMGIFDMALIDMDLAGDSGLELARKLRFINPHTLIALMSADPQYKPVIKKAGFGELWEKPVDMEAIRTFFEGTKKR